MQNQASLQETKQHGAVRFPFNLYPCTIPGDFPQVALHWQESMELVFVKRGTGLVQVGAESCPARMGDIFIFTPGTLHALRQPKGSAWNTKISFLSWSFWAAQRTFVPRNICFRCKRALVAACAADPERPVLSAGRRLPAGGGGCQPRQAPRLRAAGQGSIAAVSCPAPCTGPAAACRRDSRHPAAENAPAMALGPLYRGTPGRRCRRGLLLQCQPLHAVVPADDRAELCGLSERVPAQRRREALQATEETVLTIASRCGFENLSYFNRAFKAHFGMTPREYRKK